MAVPARVAAQARPALAAEDCPTAARRPARRSPVSPTLRRSPLLPGGCRSWSYPAGVSVGAVDISGNGRRILVRSPAGAVGSALQARRRRHAAVDVHGAGPPSAIRRHLLRDGTTAAATDGLTLVRVFTCDGGTRRGPSTRKTTRTISWTSEVSHDGCPNAAAARPRCTCSIAAAPRPWWCTSRTSPRAAGSRR